MFKVRDKQMQWAKTGQGERKKERKSEWKNDRKTNGGKESESQMQTICKISNAKIKLY